MPQRSDGHRDRAAGVNRRARALRARLCCVFLCNEGKTKADDCITDSRRPGAKGPPRCSTILAQGISRAERHLNISEAVTGWP